MIVKGNKVGKPSEIRWIKNPLTVLYSLWPEVVELSKHGVVHITGTAKIRRDVSELQATVVVYDEPMRLVFLDEDGLHFILPIQPEKGIDYLYLEILRAAGVFQ